MKNATFIFGEQGISAVINRDKGKITEKNQQKPVNNKVWMNK